MIVYGMAETCCIVRTDHIGDLVLCTGFVDAIASRYVTDVVVPASSAPLLINCPTVRRVFTLPEARSGRQEDGVRIHRRWERSAEFLGSQYDLVVNAVSSRSQLSDRVVRKIHAHRRAGFANDTANQYDPRENRMYSPLVGVLQALEPETKRYARMLEALGIKGVGVLPRVYTGWRDVEHVRSLLPQGRVVSILPEARHTFRQWPEALWQAWLDSLTAVYPDISVAWTGQNGGGYSLRHPRLVNLLGKMNLTQIAALADVSDLWIGSETGPTHIAASMGRSKTVCIIGGAHYGRFFPVSAEDKVATNRTDCFKCGDWFKCEPCPKTLRRRFECIDGIPLDTVWARTVEVLGGAGVELLNAPVGSPPPTEGVQVVPIDSIVPWDVSHQPAPEKWPPFFCENDAMTAEHWETIKQVQTLIRQGRRIRPIAVNGRHRTDGFSRYMAYKLMGYKEILVDNSVSHRPGTQDGQGWVLGKDEQKAMSRGRRRRNVWEACLRFWGE